MATAPDANPAGTSVSSPSADQVKATLTAADASANQGIQTLGQVHQARLNRATRAAAALKAQFGADDPRVKVAEAAGTAIKTTIARISIIRQGLARPAVQVAKNGWALHGYVLDVQYQPLPKFTVYLADIRNEFQKQYGFAYTGDNGYFLLNYPGDSDKPADTPKLFVGLVNAAGNPAYLSPTAFQPVMGAATFQTITLPGAAKTLGDPGRPIRAVALPAQDAQKQAASNPSPRTTP